MPTPHTRGAPYFSERTNESLTDFLVEYNALATAHGLTDDQKVSTLSGYASPRLREFWQTLNGYNTGDWTTYRASIQALYPDTSPSTRFTKKALHDLVDSWARTPMRDDDEVLEYYRRFLEYSNPLRTAETLTNEDRNAEFFRGFHPEDREILNNRLHAYRPNHPEDKPYELEDTFHVAQRYFSKTQFYRPLQRRRRDEARRGSDSERTHDRRNHRRDLDSQRYDTDPDSDRDYDRRHRDTYRGRDSRGRGHHRDRDRAQRDRDDHRSRDLHDNDHRRHRHDRELDSDRPRDRHSRNRSRDQDPPSRQSEYSTKTVRFREPNTPKNADDQELGDLIQQMHGLSVHDAGYSALYVLCKRRFPDVAQDLAKPAAHLFHPSSAPAYQASANPPPTQTPSSAIMPNPALAAPQPASYQYHSPPAPTPTPATSSAPQLWPRGRAHQRRPQFRPNFHPSILPTSSVPDRALTHALSATSSATDCESAQSLKNISAQDVRRSATVGSTAPTPAPFPPRRVARKSSSTVTTAPYKSAAHFQRSSQTTSHQQTSRSRRSRKLHDDREDSVDIDRTTRLSHLVPRRPTRASSLTSVSGTSSGPDLAAVATSRRH